MSHNNPSTARWTRWARSVRMPTSMGIDSTLCTGWPWTSTWHPASSPSGFHSFRRRSQSVPGRSKAKAKARSSTSRSGMSHRPYGGGGQAALPPLVSERTTRLHPGTVVPSGMAISARSKIGVPVTGPGLVLRKKCGKVQNHLQHIGYRGGSRTHPSTRRYQKCAISRAIMIGSPPG